MVYEWNSIRVAMLRPFLLVKGSKVLIQSTPGYEL